MFVAVDEYRMHRAIINTVTGIDRRLADGVIVVPAVNGNLRRRAIRRRRIGAIVVQFKEHALNFIDRQFAVEPQADSALVVHITTADRQTQSRHHSRELRTQKQVLTTMRRLEERGFVMTQEELKRAEEGWRILNEIEDYKEYIKRIEKDALSLVKLDEDLLEDVKNKLIQRFRQKIVELQKQFDEL